MLNVEQIARICHEANRLYCEDMHHPSILPWSYAPEWQKTSAIEGVKAIMNNPFGTPEDSHEGWCEHKIADGWTYGPVKDADAKTHPCLVPYHELPADQRGKDVLFVNIVRALMPPPAPRARPTVEELERILQRPDAPVVLRPDGSVEARALDPSASVALTVLEAGEVHRVAPTTTLGVEDKVQQEVNDGQGMHAEDGRGVAAQADGDGGKASGQEGNRPPQEGRLTKKKK